MGSWPESPSEGDIPPLEALGGGAGDANCHLDFTRPVFWGGLCGTSVKVWLWLGAELTRGKGLRKMVQPGAPLGGGEGRPVGEGPRGRVCRLPAPTLVLPSPSLSVRGQGRLWGGSWTSLEPGGRRRSSTPPSTARSKGAHPKKTGASSLRALRAAGLLRTGCKWSSHSCPRRQALPRPGAQHRVPGTRLPSAHWVLIPSW